METERLLSTDDLKRIEKRLKAFRKEADKACAKCQVNTYSVLVTMIRNLKNRVRLQASGAVNVKLMNRIESI